MLQKRVFLILKNNVVIREMKIKTIRRYDPIKRIVSKRTTITSVNKNVQQPEPIWYNCEK